LAARAAGRVVHVRVTCRATARGGAENWSGRVSNALRSARRHNSRAVLKVKARRNCICRRGRACATMQLRGRRGCRAPEKCIRCRRHNVRRKRVVAVVNHCAGCTRRCCSTARHGTSACHSCDSGAELHVSSSGTACSHAAGTRRSIGCGAADNYST
jgi:hypothetical protein